LALHQQEIGMIQFSLRANHSHGIGISSLRLRSLPRYLNLDDAAERAMIDFLEDPPLTVSEDCPAQRALDEMYRLGVRTCLVARDRVVLGLISAAHVDAAGGREAGDYALRASLRTADVMTPVAEAPAIEWDTVQSSSVRDLLEVFEGAGVSYLMVLQRESASLTSVRGIVARDRLARSLRLGSPH
jgi:predicted transcriptional regulator